MPLRRSPVLTSQSLAARRANALKSTGPRTPCGKARVSLNALKHGRCVGPAGGSARFCERLLRAGFSHQEALYRDLRARLAQALGARTPHWRSEVDRFARRAWCVATGRDFFGTKLECPWDSALEGSRVLLEAYGGGVWRSRRERQGLTRSLRYRAEDNYQRIGVAFWIQRRRYLTAARVRRITAGLERFRFEDTDEGLESRVRCLVFRLRRPGYFERLGYGLDRNGDPDWSRQPWRSMPGYREEWEARRRKAGCEPHMAAASPCAGSRNAVPPDAVPPDSRSGAEPPERPAGPSAGLSDKWKFAPANSPAVQTGREEASGASHGSRDAKSESAAGAISQVTRALSGRILKAGRFVVRGLLKITRSGDEKSRNCVR